MAMRVASAACGLLLLSAGAMGDMDMTAAMVHPRTATLHTSKGTRAKELKAFKAAAAKTKAVKSTVKVLKVVDGAATKAKEPVVEKTSGLDTFGRAKNLNEAMEYFDEMNPNEETEPLEGEEITPDFPEPVAPGSDGWEEMAAVALKARKLLSEARQEHQLSPIENSTLLHGWAQVQEEALGYKLCLKVIVQGEVEYATVDVVSTWDEEHEDDEHDDEHDEEHDGEKEKKEKKGEEHEDDEEHEEYGDHIAISAVTPAVVVLGEALAHDAAKRLTDGETMEEDTLARALFPCRPDYLSTLSYAREHRGVKHNPPMRALLGKPFPVSLAKKLGDIPPHFDSRAKWPKCSRSVQDQGGCGSCYAFATAAMVAERNCIFQLNMEGEGEMEGEKEGEAAQAEGKVAVQVDLDVKVDVKTGQELNLGAVKGSEKALGEILAKQLDANVTVDHVEARLDAAPSLLQYLKPKSRRSLLRKSRGRSAEGPSAAEEAFVLSQQELVSCGSADRDEYRTPYCLIGPGNRRIRKYTNGCQGGSAFNSIMYVNQFGLPTQNCIPYVSGGGGDSLKHFEVQAGKVPLCRSLEAKACHSERAQHRVSSPRTCPDGDVKCIQYAILEGGPVFASVKVTKYFMEKYHVKNGATPYPGDVFFRAKGDYFVGDHAVVVHGWGSAEDGTKYWWARNSWSATWGLEGLFKLKRGSNELGVEEGIHYAFADPGQEEDIDGECVKVTQEGSTCTVVNVCEESVRAVKISYLGTPDKCGSWTIGMSRFGPGQANAEVIGNAFRCTVVSDVEVGKADNKLFYEDITADYAPQYNCVLHNKYQGAGKRVRCCGSKCSSLAAGNRAAFPSMYCAAGCKAAGYQVTERVQ